jgi:dolichol-phosphate mannosyltransferase
MSMLVDQRSTTTGVELTVVVPSYNEIDNVEPLIHLLGAALDGIEWEVIYVELPE